MFCAGGLGFSGCAEGRGIIVSLCVLELCALGSLFFGADHCGSGKSRCCPTALSSWKLGVCAPHVSSQSWMGALQVTLVLNSCVGRWQGQRQHWVRTVWELQRSVARPSAQCSASFEAASDTAQSFMYSFTRLSGFQAGLSSLMLQKRPCSKVLPVCLRAAAIQLPFPARVRWHKALGSCTDV